MWYLAGGLPVMAIDFRHSAEIWRPRSLPIDFFRARGFEHCYDRHTHDEFAIGVMETGVQKFFSHKKNGSWPKPTPALSLFESFSSS
jgi:hypothetical protein